VNRSIPNGRFVNSEILGQMTFAVFVPESFVARHNDMRADQIVVTDHLTPGERLARRLACSRPRRRLAATIRDVAKTRIDTP
jgi:hypothetical protein